MQRLIVLVRFSSRRLSELLGMRAARLYAVGVAVSFAVLMFLSRSGASAGSIDALLARALASLSWAVAGLSALSAARDLATRDREEGVTSLIALRGYDAWLLELSRTLAAALRIAFWVFVPAAVLVAFGWLLLGNPALAAWALAWWLFLVGYALALGACLGVLSRAAATLSARRGRSLLALIVIAPELLRGIWPSAPSLPRVFAWAIERATDVGKALV